MHLGVHFTLLFVYCQLFVLQEEVHWLGKTKQRLPLFSKRTPHKEFGSLATNDDLMAAMPEVRDGCSRRP